MAWTPEQNDAITSRDSSILVSAAAGSGKTAVLIERIKQLVIKDRTDIDRFLITTFTNAASAEMKERLRKALRQELEAAPKGSEERQFLRRQLRLLQRASIGTFHTFAIDIIRKYFYLTDIEPGSVIGDEIRVSILKRDSMNELFEKRFDEDYERFTGFLRRYSSGNSEDRLKEDIISLYNELRSVPGYMSWAEERAGLMKENSMKSLGIVPYIAEDVCSSLKEAAGYYREAADTAGRYGIESIAVKAEQDAAAVEDAAYAAADIEKRMTDDGDGYDAEEIFSQLAETVTGFSFNQMRAAKAEQDAYNEIKERIGDLRKKGKKLIDDAAGRYFRRSYDPYEEELTALADDTSYMIGMIGGFEKIFREKKREECMIDFDDVMHYAIEILEDDTVSAEYRERFRYIFIDEFQDSNMLQEMIVKRISHDDNVFMVGDVKQSIYKFRLAEPEIFMRKYKEFSDPGDGHNKKIDLNSNFRSKCDVTDTVNAVFENAMEGYDDSARLRCGIGEEKRGYVSRMTLVDTADAADDMRETGEFEAEQIADIIRDDLGKTIFDVKRGSERAIRLRDIVVLSRSRNLIPVIERYLNNEGIAAFGDDTGGYFETVEIQVFINLLRVIDNSSRDIPLISVMDSVIFDFTARDLAVIRTEFRDGSFHSAVERYLESGSDDDIRRRIADMRERLSYWKALRMTVPLEELLRRLLYDTGYFEYCSGLPAGRQRTANLDLLMEKAAEFEETDHSGLYGFLSYIDAMKRNSVKIGEAKTIGEDEDAVRIMTVHASKGLEFPVVILAGAGRQIRPKGMGTAPSMHKEFGIGLPLVNREEGWHRKTILQRVIERKKAQEETEEEVRILYVALTRAMDRIEVTGTVRDADRLDENRTGKGSYIEMMYPAFAGRGDEIVIKDASGTDGAGADLHAAGHITRSMDMLEMMIDKTEMPREDSFIGTRLSYTYPYAGAEKVRSKYSVTELADGSEGRRLPSELKKPGFTGERENAPDAAQIGTAIHKVMEKLDFAKALEGGTGYIEAHIADMVEKGYVTPEEAGRIDTESIRGFFDDDIGRRAALSGKTEKEKEFTMLMEKDGAETIVQGIIDCCFEEDGHLVLIDYKNSRAGRYASEGDIAERYRGQLELYGQALEAATGMEVSEKYLYMFDMKKFIKAV